jgi:putative PIN family toxin of toxin-antitoxin system
VRVVIDSNVWVSALVFGGNPRRVLEKIVGQDITIVTSEEINTEVRRILGQKFPDFVQDFEQLLAILRLKILVVRLGGIQVAASRDEDDNRVLETALIGGALCVISGDKDLLVLGHYGQIRMLSPQEFLALE